MDSVIQTTHGPLTRPMNYNDAAIKKAREESYRFGRFEGYAEAKTEALNMSMAQVKRDHFVRVFAHHQGNRQATWNALGIGHTTFYRYLEKYGNHPQIAEYR